MFSIKASPDIIVRYTPDGGSVRGDVLIVEGVYTQDVSIPDIRQVLGAKRPKVTQAPDTGIGSKIELQIAVQSTEDIRVENNLASVRVNPDIRIGGTVSHPLVSGRANITRGSVSYLRGNFNVQQGSITFTNPNRIEPQIDVRAASEVEQYRITLEISGTADQLRFNLSSTPQLREQDIISLLVAGRTTSNLFSRQETSEVTTSQMLQNMLGKTISSQIQKNTVLDSFAIESVGPEATDVSVTAGTKINERTSILYTITVEQGETRHRTSADYKLSDNITVRGYQSQGSSFGAEIEATGEFR